MTAGKEPSVEEIVARLEREIALDYDMDEFRRDIAALISDWRRRGEERDSARALLRDLWAGGLLSSRATADIRARIAKELGPTREDEPRSPRAS